MSDSLTADQETGKLSSTSSMPEFTCVLMLIESMESMLIELQKLTNLWPVNLEASYLKYYYSEGITYGAGHENTNTPRGRAKTRSENRSGSAVANQSGQTYLKGAAAELLSLSWFLSHAEWEPSVARSPDFFNRSQESGFLCEVRFFFYAGSNFNRKKETEKEEEERAWRRGRERGTPCESCLKARCCHSGVVAASVKTVAGHWGWMPMAVMPSHCRRSPGFIITTVQRRGLYTLAIALSPRIN